MRYKYNVNNEYCGVDPTDTEGVEEPVRNLKKGERAFWTGERWSYDFYKAERKKNEPSLPIKYASFKISRKCNRKCPYCAIGRDYVNNNIVSEEEALKTFYKCIDKADELCEKNGFTLIPQISGGEPTLMSYENQERVIERFKKYDKWTLLTNGADISSPFFKNAPEILIHIIDWWNKKFLDNEYDSRVIYAIVVAKGEVNLLEPVLKKNNSLEKPHALYIRPEVLTDNICLTEEEISEMHKITQKYCWQENFDTWQNIRERGGIEAVRKICSLLKRNSWIFDCQDINECQPCCCNNPVEFSSLEDFTGERTISCDECNVPEIGYLSDDILREVFGESEAL